MPGPPFVTFAAVTLRLLAATTAPVNATLAYAAALPGSPGRPFWFQLIAFS